MSTRTNRGLGESPVLVAIVGWFIPRAGYLLLGQRWRAFTIGITIVVLFFLGIFLAGVRVVDVPGYDRFGNKVKVDTDGRRIESFPHNDHYEFYDWALTGRGFFGEVVNKPWYICQILTGPVCLIMSGASLSVAHDVPMSHARIFEIGTLYTAVAGLLNLLAMIDASHRAARAADDDGAAA